MDLFRTVFVPAPRLPEGRENSWADRSPLEPPRDVPGLRGTPPVAPTPEPKGQVGPTETRVDGPGLASAVQEALAALASDGYTLHTITPLQSGAYGYESDFRQHFETWFSAGAGYGYGTSYTEGILIVAQRA